MKSLDEEAIKSKFENKSKVLDDILSSQIPSSDKSSLGYEKEKKSKYSSLTNQGGNKRSYVDVRKKSHEKGRKQEIWSILLWQKQNNWSVQKINDK